MQRKKNSRCIVLHINVTPTDARTQVATAYELLELIQLLEGMKAARVGTFSSDFREVARCRED